MMQQPQQVHHLIPQSAVTATHNRGGDHHHHHQQQQQSHTPKEMNKPKGRMSAYTFFVQKCRDEHRKAYPNENANFSEFSKKCAEKWKVRIIVTMNKSRTIVCHPYISIRNVRLKS